MSMKRPLAIILFIFGMFAGENAMAFHIVGGDFTARHKFGNTWEVTLKLFRDCSNSQGAPFDPSITMGVFRKGTNQLELSVEMYLDSIKPLGLTGNACAPPPQVCMEIGYYVQDVIIPNYTLGHYLIWERCCRNSSVVNLNNPQNTAMAFYLELPNPTLQNSTAVFTYPPLPYMCIDQPFTYNFSATDIDNDSLWYKLVTPLDGGHSDPTQPNPFSLGGGGQTPVSAPYAPVAWAPGYSTSNIIDGNPTISLNSYTGIVTCTPLSLGLYAMAIVCEEYRNGVKIGLTRREIEFFVIPCNQNATPNISPTQAPGSNSNYDLFAGDTLCFDIKFSDPDDSLFVEVTGDCLPGGTAVAPFATAQIDSGLKNVNVNFCWETTCDHISTTPYKVKYTVRDNGCPLPKYKSFDFTITVKEPPNILPVNLLCMEFLNANTMQMFYGIINPQDSDYFKYFIIYKSIAGGAFFAFDTIYNTALDNFIDTAATNYANINYCYFIKGYNNCDRENISDTVCTEDRKNKTENYIRTVSVLGPNEVNVKWENFPDAYFSTLYLYRKENDFGSGANSYSLINTLTQYTADSIIDVNTTTGYKSYCYYMINQNYCKNFSPESNDACTILLTGEAGTFLNSMKWNEYKTWRGGVATYEILRAEGITAPFKPLVTLGPADYAYIDQQLDFTKGFYRYIIKASEGPNGLNEVSWSNEIPLTQIPQVFVPSAYTPNDDGVNEFWKAQATFVRDFSCVVYNRWGQLVFSSNDIFRSWNGTYNGEAAPQGVYFYRIKYSGYDSTNQYEKTGSVTILR